jgi:hypothetical protein
VLDTWDLDADNDTSESVRQVVASDQLLIEYVRGDEKPIIVTVRPIPEGPSEFTAEDVAVSNSLQPGSPTLPDVTSAKVELDAFTPGLVGSDVAGTVDVLFTNTDTGDTFSLHGAFAAALEVMP